MNEVERIIRQMKQMVYGEAWYGPSLSELLDGVDAAVACAHPIQGTHSIWEIVLHLITTQELILDRIRNVSRPFTPGDEWPPVDDMSESAWKSAAANLLDGDEKVRAAVAGFAEKDLDRPLVEGSSSAYNNFHGYVQHAIYHAGQIGLLIKASGARSSEGTAP